jgi:AcrR family transcriptional regulator
MVEVARTAGVARATLYNHYSDVPSILADATTRHNEQAISGLRQTLAVAGSPTDTIEQIVRYVAAISRHGHTLDARHGLPPELREQLTTFDDELESQIRIALENGTATGEFRSDLHREAGPTLVRHMLHGVSELVAAAPDRAPEFVHDTTRTILAAVTDRTGSREP